MTLRTQMQRIFQQEDINFLLTNRLPRRLLTQFIGWFSRIEQAPIPRLSISLWRLFSDLDLSDAGIRRFRSMHECFTRQLKAGARPIDPDHRFWSAPVMRSSAPAAPSLATSFYRSRAFRTRWMTCWAGPQTRTRTVATLRSGSRPACTTASTRLMIAASSW